MKKRKLIRNVSLVALSAVMMCGAAVAFAGCGKDKTYQLSVNIFCNDSDAATNRAICNRWAESYTEELRAAGKIAKDAEITVDFRSQASQDNYFQALGRDYSSGKAADIIYLSPKYVKAWVAMGRVMDISEFIKSDTDIANVNGIWSDSLGLYGYAGGATKGSLADGYQMGDSISYLKAGETPANSTTAVTEDGFYTATGIKTGLYGLPKDYSNFGMAYNGKYFTQDLKKAMTTQKATENRTVKGARGNIADKTFTGKNDGDVITYAVTDDYTNPYTGETMHAVEGQDAPIINIGVPTRYKPYNFYRFDSYKSAKEGGDPIALATEVFTGDEGYVVTIPGFPGETFKIADATGGADVKVDEKAIYDNTIGHITYTYQEFGALTWALCYYYNTFNWNCKTEIVNNKGGDPQAFDIAKTTSGTGGIKLESGTMTNVYGNDQYEGAPGPTLYLLPWLYGNDADFINSNSTRAIAGETGNAADFNSITSVAAMKTALESAKGENQNRLNLDGTTTAREIKYGLNTDRFAETYGAFIEYGSTWNGNCGNCGDEDTTKSDNGWSFFRAGAELFYGSGTWDSATRNESDYRDGPEGFCDFHMMPQAVGEKYALYSTVKDGYYNYVEYSSETAGEDGYAVATENVGEGIPAGAYSMADVYANQIKRQDKWGARMDSVGFAANSSLAAKAGTEEEWKIEGAASLIMALCINEEAQVTLTYSGAQLPNFEAQCIDFLHYQEDKYADGTFKDMITPEGSATVTEDAGHKLWNEYYAIAYQMDQDARINKVNKTVGEYLADKKLSNGDPVQYDPQYKDTKLTEFTGELTNRGFAMKVLRMTTFTYADRDINLRMQYGLNSARDSAMYTYNTNWINLIQMRDGSCLAYDMSDPAPFQPAKGSTQTFQSLMRDAVRLTPDKELGNGYQTAAVFCLKNAQKVQDELVKAINLEQAAIDKA